MSAINGEFVMDAANVSRPGMLATLQAMQKCARGYADGGYVQLTDVRSSGGGSSADVASIVRSVIAEMPRGDIHATIQKQPIRDQNPRTAAVLAARELERALRITAS